MAAVPLFPGVPQVNYRDREEGSSNAFIGRQELDTEWPASNFQAMTLKTDALNDMEILPEMVSYRHVGDPNCKKFAERRCSIDAPLAWRPDWNGPNNPLPCYVEGPQTRVLGSQWTYTDQDTSCSGGSTWSPKTSDSRSEADGYWSHTVSQNHESTGLGVDYHPQGPLCFPKEPPYQQPGREVLISPHVLQQYPEELMEETSMKPDLHEMTTRDLYFPESMAKAACCDRPEFLGRKESPSPPHKVESRGSSIHGDDDSAMDDRPDHDDDDEDYNPGKTRGQGRRFSHRSSQARNHTPAVAYPQRIKSKTSQAAKPTKIAKKTAKPSAASPPIHKVSNLLACHHCPSKFSSESALKKHVLASHTRPFLCTFHRYGCSSTVGSKNEWKRHINVQHMHLETWRCDIGACVAPSSETKDRRNGVQPAPMATSGPVYHEFDRKDLFTQHLKRMHAPSSSASRAERTRFENQLEAIQKRCHRILRGPPAKSICPYCPDHPVFESWDERVEHVGRHLEKSDFDQKMEIEDQPLLEWLNHEEYLVWKGAGQGWRLKDMGKKRKSRGEKMTEEGEEDAEGEDEE